MSPSSRLNVYWRWILRIGGIVLIAIVALFIVLNINQRIAPGSTPFDDQRVPVSQEFIEAQAALASLSSQGEQRVIESSGHQVHLDAPEAVIDAVRDLLEVIP